MINFADNPGGSQRLRFTPNDEEMESIAIKVSAKLIEQKNQWIKGVAKKYMPDFVIAWAESGDHALMDRASKWINKKQFHLQEHPDGRCRMMKGDKILSDFRTIIKDGKVEFETRDCE